MKAAQSLFSKAIIILILCLIYFKSSAQIVFLSHADLAKLKINSITNLKNTPLGMCNCVNIDTCAHLYKFKLGKLVEMSYHASATSRFTDKFEYSGGRLIGQQVDMGASQEQHFVKYIYRNDKLFSSYQINSHYDLDSQNNYKSDNDFEDFKRYYYDERNRLTRVVSFEVINKKREVSSVRYYLYDKNILLGYFPAKDGNTVTTSPSDSIYYQNKIEELEKEGFLSFKKKYLQNVVLSKVLEDCQIPVHENELLINGQPVGLFLKRIDKQSARELVIEVSENNFIFFKLLKL